MGKLRNASEINLGTKIAHSFRLTLCLPSPLHSPTHTATQLTEFQL